MVNEFGTEFVRIKTNFQKHNTMIIFVREFAKNEIENDKFENLIGRKTKVVVNLKVYSKGEMINLMLGEMELYMKEHQMTVQVFSHEHCGYHSISRLNCCGCFCEGLGKKTLYFSSITDTHFELVCELYDAFFNDPLLPNDYD